MDSEARIQFDIHRSLGREPDLEIWRNNVGEAVYEKGGRTYRVRYGLCPGSSDLVGILAPNGRLIGLEVKTPSGKLRQEQQMFLDRIRRRGGFAAVVRSVEEARAALERAREGGDR